MTLDFGARRRISALALVTGLFAGCGGDSSNGVTIKGGPAVKTCTSTQDCSPGQVCGSTGMCTDVTVPPEVPVPALAAPARNPARHGHRQRHEHSNHSSRVVGVASAAAAPRRT